MEVAPGLVTNHPRQGLGPGRLLGKSRVQVSPSVGQTNTPTRGNFFGRKPCHWSLINELANESTLLEP